MFLHVLKHSKNAETQSKQITWENGSSQTQNNSISTLTSAVQTECVQTLSNGIQTDTKLAETKTTQSELNNSAFLPSNLVDDWEDRITRIQSAVHIFDLEDMPSCFENYHAPITLDRSLTHHINIGPPEYNTDACVKYPPYVADHTEIAMMSLRVIEVFYLDGNSAFQNELVVRHKTEEELNYSLGKPGQIGSCNMDTGDRYDNEHNIAKMILALKEHVKIHKCRKWNFKFMNPPEKNYW